MGCEDEDDDEDDDDEDESAEVAVAVARSMVSTCLERRKSQNCGSKKKKSRAELDDENYVFKKVMRLGENDSKKGKKTNLDGSVKRCRDHVAIQAVDRN
jgi:hypothetical protein